MNDTTPRTSRPGWVLVLFVFGCEAVGISGVLGTGPVRTGWYAELVKPPFQPPPWVFGPVWTLLYAMMGVAAWRVWMRRARPGGTGAAMPLFLAQLVLNGLWTPVFFGAHEVGLALAVILALLATLFATLLSFRRVDRPAAWLLVPYLLWVGFASVLNASIFALN